MNTHVFDQLLHRLNPRLKTYNQICFDTNFVNTKNLTLFLKIYGYAIAHRSYKINWYSQYALEKKKLISGQ
jgi:hypothetical protein